MLDRALGQQQAAPLARARALRTLLSIVLLPLLAACASTSTTQLPLNPENDNEATVHIFRERVAPLLYGLEISVDGKMAAVLANGSYVSFSVPTGERQFLFQWPSGTLERATDKLEGTLTFKGRETRYFLVEKDALQNKSSVFAPAISVPLEYSKLHIRLMELPAEAGKGLMQKLSRDR